MNDIIRHRLLVQGRIEKSFQNGLSIDDAKDSERILKSANDDLFKGDSDTEENKASSREDLIKAWSEGNFEKARSGTYANTSENRKLGSVSI